MKNKKWISLAAAVIFAVTALPATVFAAKNGESKEELTKVTLNEVAHSIFYAPQYVAIEEGYIAKLKKRVEKSYLPAFSDKICNWIFNFPNS